MSIHGGVYTKARDNVDQTETCQICGSLKPSEALRRMTTPGCRFSGTDKNNYKFYFYGERGEFGKFYGEHLADLSKEELAEWAETSRRVLGVDWEYVPGRAPSCLMPHLEGHYGWQTWGDIDSNGLPVFKQGAPIPPTEQWWAEAREAAKAKSNAPG